MKVDYPKIKKFLHIGTFSINLLIFLLVLFSTSSKSKNYKEYTGASVFFLDLYIIAIDILLIVLTIIPGLFYHRLKKHFLFIFTDKGKVIINFLISLIYWFARNKPQFVLGFLLTITSIILLIYEFIFYFTKVENFLSTKGIEFSNKGQPIYDVNEFEKNEGNSSTPRSTGNIRYQSSQNDVNHNTSYDSGDNHNNPQNPSSAQYQRDVEISSGYGNN